MLISTIRRYLDVTALTYIGLRTSLGICLRFLFISTYVYFIQGYFYKICYNSSCWKLLRRLGSSGPLHFPWNLFAVRFMPHFGCALCVSHQNNFILVCGFLHVFQIQGVRRDKLVLNTSHTRFSLFKCTYLGEYGYQTL